jgi:hypothetical protein
LTFRGSEVPTGRKSRFARPLVLAVIDQEVQVAALVGLQYMRGVKALIATKRCRSVRWSFSGPTSQLLFVDQQIESAGGGVEHDLIAVTDKSDGTADGRLGRDV